MKIAIMTQPLGTNYGGIMQDWALQQALKKMGHHAITIDHRPYRKNIFFNATRITYRTLMKVLGKRKTPIFIDRYMPYILENTRNFINENINVSPPIFNTKQLREHFDNEKYDAVIVGSDQVWRPKYSPNIENYYLDFLENKKIIRIAYAASFGVDEWEYTEKQTQRCSELAKKFDFIGVRESTGATLCRNHLNVEAIQVLDPTLLLDINDYIKLIGLERLNDNRKGVYSYILDKNHKKNVYIRNLSTMKEVNLFSCQSKFGLHENQNNLDDYRMPKIQDWLAGFANSNYIVTDSFHGMIFSLINQKPFKVFLNKSRGNTRFHSLLKTVDAEEVLNDEIYIPTKTQMQNTADRIKKLQKESLDLLRQHL